MITGNTKEALMAAKKVAITMDRRLLVELDGLVAENVFANRSQAIQAAVQEKLARMRRSRLARECAKLDSAQEQAMAEEGMPQELAQWPEY
jgi:metal-responsive CopG/Arc/MetJ family transcriptional regulator